MRPAAVSEVRRGVERTAGNFANRHMMHTRSGARELREHMRRHTQTRFVRVASSRSSSPNPIVYLSFSIAMSFALYTYLEFRN